MKTYILFLFLALLVPYLFVSFSMKENKLFWCFLSFVVALAELFFVLLITDLILLLTGV